MKARRDLIARGTDLIDVRRRQYRRGDIFGALVLKFVEPDFGPRAQDLGKDVMEKASDVEYTLAVNGHGCMDLQCEAILSLGSCSRRFRLLAGDELQQHSNALLRFLDTATDRRHNVFRLGDPLAIATERTCHG